MIEEEEVPEPTDSTQMAQLVSKGWMEGGKGRRKAFACVHPKVSYNASKYTSEVYYSMCHHPYLPKLTLLARSSKSSSPCTLNLWPT